MKAPVFLNEDPNHFVYDRGRANKLPITKEDALAFIDQYKNTGVTDFLVCLNDWYPCKRLRSIIDRYRELREKEPEKAESIETWGAKIMTETYESGVNLHALWFSRIREIGMRPWISIRMNDIHNSSVKGHLMNNELINSDNPPFRASYRTLCGYFDYTLDYRREEVRSYFRTMTEEALDTFDADGIELDFMREIYCFPVGCAEEGMPIMTDFIAGIRRYTEELGKKRGHKIQLSVRLPASIELCMRLGFDVFSLVREGLCDVITVCPRWATADSDMPIDVWKKTFAGYPVRILAGIEYLLCGERPRGGLSYGQNTLDTALGYGCAYLDMGADGLYLFNYMDTVAEHNDLPADCIVNKGYHELLTLLGDREAMEAHSRRHVSTYCDISAPGIGIRRPLPTRVCEGESEAIRIPRGRIAAGRKVRIVLGMEEGDGINGETVEVYAGTSLCPCIGKTKAQNPMPARFAYYVYEMPEEARAGTVTVLDLYGKTGTVTLHWAEIQVE